ncbi:hypothetical protein N7468_007740 [Penicillium chermesinum]|uniref:Uncharacterized protein n=1 Tax=Penicillium chermesinum TaxID=63820 RepID=A0A9W9NUM9_9EURO|nr:uncharacterized protein N7468_007740 [Penicillium chermesinum]KAJ5226515.1 hypothetical protein N7468_007740 [Penicillium chermesinum]KAJ6160307.1 hypothetical protein N7470_003703 [Penicillium chermesinum]
MNRPKPRGLGRGSRPSYPSVPPSRSVNPGTGVNIVLKADQPTGRTVSGTVSEVLTRGDHPRGVKVRLVDGRVGRVQSLRNGDQADSPGIDEGEGGLQIRREGGNPGRRAHIAARDMRLDGPQEPSPEPFGLDAYIRPAKGKKRGGKSQAQQTAGESNDGRADVAPTPAATASCPVCGTFEGDEAAVAHHVATHFED